MLKSLYIKNIALISQLNVDFSDKLNIFSGETGSGKSIIIDSLNFMLGAKADKTMIRSNETSATVEGDFDIGEREDVKSLLADFNIEADDDIIISRVLTTTGKNEIRINGKLVTLSMLREISHKLVDVHGQSEHFLLNKVATHLELLDKFGKNDVEKALNTYKIEYDKYQDIIKELNSFGGNESERARLIDLYDYQIKEIEEFDLKEGEEEQLNAKFVMITNVEKIASNLNACIEALTSDGGAINSLSEGYSFLSSISNLNEQFPQLIERIKSARIECEDIGDTLTQIEESLNFDEREADTVAERLEKIKSLKRKYGNSFEDIQKYLQRVKGEYDKLVNASERIEQLNIDKEKALIAMERRAKELTAIRKQKAEQLSQLIVSELFTLGMEHATSEVYFKEGEFINMFGAKGADDVEFMFSANLGEPLKPLVKVISGGEMSRFMLGLKTITASLDDIGTLVFDEIDSGISGKIAHVVAEKFIKLSQLRQVIVITHLPQIAAAGDKNFLISKGVVGNHTESMIEVLNDKEKIKEIARLSGAKELTQNAVFSANELINTYKRTL